MDFLGFMGFRVIYLTEYLIQSYIAFAPAHGGTPSIYITIPPSTTKTWPVM